jgi:predicted RNase H-like HicB family nuclease
MYEIDGICYGEGSLMHVVEAKPLGEGRILVTFSQEETRVFDVASLKGPVFEPLRNGDIPYDPVVQNGVLTWGDGKFDVAPEFAYAHSIPLREAMERESRFDQNLDYFVNLPYKLVFEVDPDEGGYVISFPELKGCLSCAETIEDACKMAIDAKRTWFGAAAEEGIDIPVPVTFKTEKEMLEFKARLQRLRETLAESGE